MSSINIEHAKYRNWFKEYSWENQECPHERKTYGEYLSFYIRSQKAYPSHDESGLVLNLNSAWGTGKSYFLRELYTNLLKKHNFPVVHINAWKSDFSQDPLLVITSELLEQVHKLHPYNPNIERKLLNGLATLGKRIWNVGVSTTAWTLINQAKAFGLEAKNEDGSKFDGTATTELLKHFQFNDLEKKQVARSLISDYREQLNAIDTTKQSLKAYAETLPTSSKKVIVLVDELDRCRPTYAIEMLETIKHFFDIDNFVFVVATDTEQLAHSVKAVYGNSFDGGEYLSRFFNRTATLPLVNVRSFIESELNKTSIMKYFDFGTMLPTTNSCHSEYPSGVIHMALEIEKISILYDLTFRRLKQLIGKFESILIYTFEAEDFFSLFDFRVLLQLLAEYSSPKYRKIYEWRKIAPNSGDLSLPSYIIQSLDIADDANLLDVLINEKQVGHIYSNDNGDDDFNDIASKCMKFEFGFSWEFVCKCNSPGFERKIVREFALADSSGMYGDAIEKAKRLHVLDYQKNIGEGDLFNSHTRVWRKEKYFKAVELSESIG